VGSGSEGGECGHVQPVLGERCILLQMDPSAEAIDAQAELILQARKGDADAWETLVRDHQTNVFRLAYLFLGDSAEAEDVAQETFLRAHRSLLRFDTSRPLRPWLLSIAANLARNRWRAIGRYLSALQRLVQSEPTHSPTAEQQSVNNLQYQRLWSAVKQLDHVDQQVIYLRYFLDMSTEETSDAMRIAPGTVKSRLHRALTRLRSVIEDEYPDLKDALG